MLILSTQTICFSSTPQTFLESNNFRQNHQKFQFSPQIPDGENDCGDGSDEDNCPHAVSGSRCLASEYQCQNGQCIPKSYQCDRHNDCMDGSDEVGCATPTIAVPPPASINLRPRQTFNITCRAVGIPTPIIVWRLNWGHVSEKCISTTSNGYGTLTCHDIEVRDSGAYSCESLNSMGSTFAIPDTILNVSDNEIGPPDTNTSIAICPSGYFNDQAHRADECVSCFCFGASTHCKSANLYTYALPPPVTSLTVVGVVGPWTGARSISVTEFDKHDLVATRHGIQLRLTELPLSGELPYYSLPDNYLGNQLKSYGGTFRYDVEYSGEGRPNDIPDVILMVI